MQVLAGLKSTIAAPLKGSCKDVCARNALAMIDHFLCIYPSACMVLRRIDRNIGFSIVSEGSIGNFGLNVVDLLFNLVWVLITKQGSSDLPAPDLTHIPTL